MPTGTITFLFSDIEGSTKLLNRLGSEYPDLLETHQRLLREAFAARDGVEVATEGDSFFVVFPSASQAVAAAVAGQRALAGHAWPEGVEVRVRMGMHTGEAILGADNYVGIDVHRAARIAGVGHGGQILASQATRALVAQSLPEGTALRDLGEHRLKDLAHAERLFQVTADGLPADFPPPRSLDARPTNLPQQLTTFIGRHQELAEVKAALGESRLLTLTGPGGTGKTRLSLQAASELLDGFEDGVFFVALAPITEPSLVVATIRQTLGVTEDPQRASAEVLIEHLRDKEMLLVLDNFEQVTEAAPEVGEILGATEDLKVLATSREPLGLHGEREYPVPPLGVPDIEHLPSLDSLSQYEAVTLFIDRAKAVNPGFSVTDENAPSVAEITARLDGLPLAIELAAARSKILTPQAMLKRMTSRLSLLGGTGRDRPDRQQTLRGAIAWSYDLLEEQEQRLFAVLSVFVGGFSLEAVDAVCVPDAELAIDPLDGVSSLVNKSLLRQMAEGDEPRFFMLETIREFARERLEQTDHADAVRGQHAVFFLGLAERAAPELTGEQQAEWLGRLATEHDNLRAAFDWAVDRGDAELAFGLGARLWRFWQFRGHLREARGRLERALKLSGGSPEARAETLEAAGGVVYWMGDFAAARVFYEECLELRRRIGEPRAVAEALYNLSFVFHVPAESEIDLARGRELLEESHGIFQEIGDQRGKAKVAWAMANVYLRSGDVEGAEASARESLEANRALGDRFGMGWALHTVGLTLVARGKADEARQHLTSALEIFSDAGDLSGIALLLADFAAAALEEGDRDRAATLAGAAFAHEEQSGIALGLALVVLQRLMDVREDLERRPAYAEGQAMSTEDAVEFAFGRDRTGQAP